MDRNQRCIGEFVAFSGKKKSNTGARLNFTSEEIQLVPQVSAVRQQSVKNQKIKQRNGV